MGAGGARTGGGALGPGCASGGGGFFLRLALDAGPPPGDGSGWGRFLATAARSFLTHFPFLTADLALAFTLRAVFSFVASARRSDRCLTNRCTACWDNSFAYCFKSGALSASSSANSGC